MFVNRFRPGFAALAGAAALTLAACGAGDTPTGTVRVALTDAPSCGFDQVNITVQRVRFHRSASAGDNEAGWTDLVLNPARRINLLDLQNGRLEELGQAPLEPGQYTQLRLVLASNSSGGLPANSVVPAGGTETALATPSAVQSGIKLINTFTVASNKVVDVVIDFDACRSVVARGNGTYSLKPVLRAVPRDVATINGFVEATLTGAVISAQRNGAVVRSTVPDATGGFSLPYLDPALGPVDVVITAPGRATAVVAAVPTSTSTSTRSLSTAAAPIILPVSLVRTASGTVTLVPAPATIEATSRALQAIGGLPSVEVAFANSSASGAYSLSLPIAAPVLAAYSTTLPLTFLTQSASAGKYTLEAGAEGFAAKTQAIDVSTANATWNVTLP